MRSCQARHEGKVNAEKNFDQVKNSQYLIRYQKLLASCSNITYYKDNGNRGYIEATDCVNGTWFQSGEMSRVDYETLLVNYERYRSDRSRMVARSSADPDSLVPWEEDITIIYDVGDQCRK